MAEKSYWQGVGDHAGHLVTVREEVTRRAGLLGRAAEQVGRFLSHPALFVALLLAHLAWVVLNLRAMPWRPWDPYPFTFLATVASVEAPFIALLVLMHQRREARIGELRDEVELQVVVHLERQGTALLRLLDAVARQLQVDTESSGVARERLDELEEELDPETLIDGLRRRLERDEGSDPTAP